MSLFTDVTNSYIMNVITSYAMKHDFILDVIMRSLLFLLLVIVIIRGRTTVQYEKVGDLKEYSKCYTKCMISTMRLFRSLILNYLQSLAPQNGGG